jgi:hypothetical protein
MNNVIDAAALEERGLARLPKAEIHRQSVQGRVLRASLAVGQPPTQPTKETMMPSQKYLLLLRSAAEPGSPRQAPSPAQMQEMFAAFNAWKEKFKDNILDMGGKLKPGGKVVSSTGVLDGPLVEAKEIVGGYMIVTADSYERALQIAKEGPGMVAPGNSIEIREISSP